MDVYMIYTNYFDEMGLLIGLLMVLIAIVLTPQRKFGEVGKWIVRASLYLLALILLIASPIILRDIYPLMFPWTRALLGLLISFTLYAAIACYFCIFKKLE